MRVAVITQYFPTSAQPWAGHSAYQTLRRMTKFCDLKVFYPEARYPSMLKPASRTYGCLDPTWQPQGVTAMYIPYRVLPLISRPLNGVAASAALLSEVQRYQPDVILNYVVYPDGHAAVRIGEDLGIPAVLTAIGSDLNRISDPVCGALTRSTLRRASSLITVSGDLLTTARRLGANASTSSAVLNGCDIAVFHPRSCGEARKKLALPQDGEIVLYVGRLDRRKGLLELVDAAAALRQKRPKLHVYLVGDGPDRPLMVAAGEKHGAAGWLTLIPSCSTSEVATWMAASNLVTLPSYKEGCPNVVIEALASGRPVVATAVGGIPELMNQESGQLVPAHDATALTRALDEVLAASWDASTLSRAHSRSWDEVAADVYGILEGAVRGKRHGFPAAGSLAMHTEA